MFYRFGKVVAKSSQIGSHTSKSRMIRQDLLLVDSSNISANNVLTFSAARFRMDALGFLYQRLPRGSMQEE
jgi:hypothetical protein